MERQDRVAAVDIGTNTFKLLVAQRQPDGAFLPLHEAAFSPRLGEGIQGGRLLETAMRRGLDAVHAILQACRTLRVDRVAAVGTAALRSAANRQEFLDRAADAGLPIHVISGDEEARLSYAAVRRDPLWLDAERIVVVDIGGGSTEIIFGKDRGPEILQRDSVPMGAVRLTEAALRSDPPTVRELAEAHRLAGQALEGLRPPLSNCIAVGVGGTLTTMAAVHLLLDAPRADRIHGTRLSLGEVEAQIAHYAMKTVDQRRRIPGLDPKRADIILGGAVILNRVLHYLGIDSIAVSARGLRWGLLYDRFGSPPEQQTEGRQPRLP